MDFGDMLKEMKAHPEKKFSRKGWNGVGMYIQLQVPDEHSKMSLPYIYMKTVQGDLVPWLASQTDILTDDDWVEVTSTPIGLIKIEPQVCSTTPGEYIKMHGSDWMTDPKKRECLCAHTKKELQDHKFDNQPNPKKDGAVHNPAHYCGDRKYQPWDVITDWDLDFLLGNAVKYIARAGRKQQAGMTMKQSEEQDILKAIEYLQKRLDIMRVIRDFDDN